ncbi:hypothetical protein GS397_00855 [Sphingobium yanoikuyae]|uniref:Uncharacterized protein n=1 Tax=Sphingobium yanoikuyae TaxID=13690 RepID=A0A6P1GB82_SPHYA|nr:hypothetical protein [Sphingobium yanoikuyae]QHD65759.1 hypothetical protein GS397_00855 [Sphingobium yanoikuyae]
MSRIISFPARRVTAPLPQEASDIQEARYRVNSCRWQLAWWEAELAALTIGTAANDRRA